MNTKLNTGCRSRLRVGHSRYANWSDFWNLLNNPTLVIQPGADSDLSFHSMKAAWVAGRIYAICAISLAWILTIIRISLRTTLKRSRNGMLTKQKQAWSPTVNKVDSLGIRKLLH